MSDKGIIIFGPGGCGKSYNAEALRRHFGLDRVDHEWDGKSEIKTGTLALTNRVLRAPEGFRVLPFDKAMLEAGL